MQIKDKRNNLVTLSNQNSIAGLENFENELMGFSKHTIGVISELVERDPDCPLAFAYTAMCYLSGETKASNLLAEPFIRGADALRSISNDREKRTIDAMKDWSYGNLHSAAKSLDDLLTDYPSDLIASKFCQAIYFNIGNAPGILRAPMKVAEACSDSPYTFGMLAFGYEECHLLREAEEAAQKAISMKRDEPWAHHAYAHIFEGYGQLEKGASFMEDYSDTWTGLSSFMYTHNWWHLCLFYIDLNRLKEAVQIFDENIWAVDKSCVQDQINAISLLYRLERLGVDPGERWGDIAKYVVLNSFDQISVFLDLQFLYALARAGRPEAPEMLKKIIDRTSRDEGFGNAVWRDIARIAAPAIFDFARGNYYRAWQPLSSVLPRLSEIGGSHAQRDLIRLIYLDCLLSAGKLDKAQRILEMRRLARPQVAWITNSLDETYRELGLSQLSER